MRTAPIFAAAAFGLLLSAAAPAQAFDDSLPSYAPWRRDYAYRQAYVAPRHYKVRRHGLSRHPRFAYAVYCRRWSWRDYCRPYRLGGFFLRNPDFRRLAIYR